MEHAVFTYGSLLSERVLQTVLGRIPRRVTAKLHAYKRTRIRDQCYPAVIPSESNQVHGKVLLGISSEELVLLDAFEDPAYERLIVTAQTEIGEKVEARLWARAADNDGDLLLDQDWDFEKFQREDEDAFVAMCMEWKDEYISTLANKS